ncbi:hypothetical protein NIES21_15310 [Anabaenopsis circularis NIES-21]|uniref:Uncharacterized protein n=1 Tax=Anabaenopsis circularis NIES-21 TaxID=1085406 RepID=A0A1Z4GDZ4_9CYAN|nr:hypothetical protein NIES21_15310 [Anabaenopsis circularis NIES-21]
MNNPMTLLKIQIFYVKLQAGQINHPYDLAVELEKLADLAWDEVDELYPNSLLP